MTARGEVKPDSRNGTAVPALSLPESKIRPPHGSIRFQPQCRSQRAEAVKTKLLPTNVLDTVKRTRLVYQVGRKARFALGSYMGARYVPGLDSRAHYNDFMLSSTSADHLKS
jgi:hypothetical protein